MTADAAKAPADLLTAAWDALRAGDPEAGHRLLAASRHLPPAQRTAVLRALARHHERTADGASRRSGAAAGSRARAHSLVVANAAANFVGQEPPAPDGAASAQALADVLSGQLPSIGQLAATGVATGFALAWQVLDPAGLGVGSVVVTVVRAGQTVRVVELPGAATNTTITGLVDQQAYDVSVAARTALGSVGVPAQVLAVAGVVSGALNPPTGLAATPVANGIALSWVLPTQPAGSPALTSWLVLVSGPGVERSIPVDPAATSTVVTGLQGGSAYGVVLQGLYSGDVLGAAVSLLRVVAGLVSGTPFVPLLPDFASIALATLDPALRDELATAATTIAEADRLARKFTYDYLAEHARGAAEHALRYDEMIAKVVDLAVGRSETAELLTNEAVLAAIKTIQGDTQNVASLLSDPLVNEAIGELSDAATTVITLTTIVTWLSSFDALEFWRDFLEALVRDVIAFDTSFSRVGDFVEEQYAGPLGEVLASVKGQIDEWIATLGQPLETAVASLVGEASAAMAGVYTSFDLPLTMAKDSTGALVPNFDPLAGELTQLQQVVAEVVGTLREQIGATLDGIAGGEGAAVVRAIVIAFIVAPIAAALVVALVGGPITGAILAAVLTIALEELVSLIAGWITGPLQAKIDAAAQRVLAAQRAVTNAFTAVTSSLHSGASELNLLAGELSELAALLPKAFLDDVAGELAKSRDRVLASALTHALAAERALGRANATAFDVVRSAYGKQLTQAPQLPPGNDPNYLAAARLIADLDELDRQVTTLLDGKDVEIGYQISLAGVANNVSGGFGDVTAPLDTALLPAVLGNGRAILDFSSADFFDRAAPGTYRHLIERVEAQVLLKDDAVKQRMPAGVPVSVTHVGPSVVRVLANANPLAPPLRLPDGYPDSADFLAMSLYNAPATAAPFPPNSVQGMAWTAITGTRDTDPLTWATAIQKCRAYLPESVAHASFPTAVGAETAAASAEDPAHPALDAIEDDPSAYYSSGITQATPAAAVTFTATFGDGGAGISAIRLEAGPHGGFPTAYTIGYVSSAAALAAGQWLPVQDLVATVDTTGHVCSFSAATVYALQVTVSQLGPLTTGQFGFELGGLTGYRTAEYSRSIAVSAYTASSQDPQHPVSALVAPTATSYFSTMPSYAVAKTESLTLALAPGSAAPARLQLVPRPGGSGSATGMPTSITLSFYAAGSQIASYAFPVGSAVGPQDFYFAPQPCDTITISAAGTLIPDQPNQYAVQLNAVSVYAYEPPALPDDSFEVMLLQQAVEVALTAFVPTGPVSEAAASAQIGAWVAPSLAATLALVYARDRAARLWSIAKWSGATLGTDPSTAAGGLGFAALTPHDTAELAVLGTLPGAANAVPGQLAPLQGRGLRAAYVVEVAPDAVPLIEDIVLSVTTRAVTSTDLAGSVRAAHQRTSELLDRVNGLHPGLVLQLVGGGPRVTAGDTRAYQVSLRAERDRIFRAALAGLELEQEQADPSKLVSGTVDGVLLNPQTDAVLVPGAPLAAFGAANGSPIAFPNVVTLAFAPTADTPLGQQFGQVVVTPSLLGVDPAQLGTGTLRALSVSVVPMAGAVDTISYTPTVAAPLAPYVAGWTSGTPSSRLLMVGGTPDTPAGLDTLVEVAATLALDFGSAITSRQVYDVIVDVVTSLPATTLPLQ